MINANFLYYCLTVYEHEKQLLKIVSAQKKQRPKMTARKRTNKGSRSNVLKKITESLENEQYQHMLYWDNKMKKEFIIKFVHMNNPEWRNADYLELFKELDKLSNKYTTYLLDEKYDHSCKVRCKANLRKLVESKALTLIEVTYKGKSIQLRKYRLNFDVSSVRSDVSKDKMARGNNGSLQGITYIKGKLKIDNLLNEQSHCLCLSKPYSGSLVGTTSLDTSFAENRIEDTRNLILQKQPLTVYEHEKGINKNDVLHIIFMQDSVLYSPANQNASFKENKCELMECSESLCQEPQGTMALQNGGVLPIYPKESQSMESVGKFVSDNCNGPFEASESVNLADTRYEYSQLNELQSSSNSPDRLQDEVNQGLDVETKNFQQVPCPTQDVGGIFNDSISDWSEDYSPGKLLQQDGDPLWFSRVSDCFPINLPEDEDYLMSSNKARPLCHFNVKNFNWNFLFKKTTE